MLNALLSTQPMSDSFSSLQPAENIASIFISFLFLGLIYIIVKSLPYVVDSIQ